MCTKMLQFVPVQINCLVRLALLNGHTALWAFVTVSWQAFPFLKIKLLKTAALRSLSKQGVSAYLDLLGGSQ